MGCRSCGSARSGTRISTIRYVLVHQDGSTSPHYATRAEAQSVRKTGDRLQVVRVAE